MSNGSGNIKASTVSSVVNKYRNSIDKYNLNSETLFDVRTYKMDSHRNQIEKSKNNAKSALASAGISALSFLEGIGNIGEALGDGVGVMASNVCTLFGNDEKANEIMENVKRDSSDEWYHETVEKLGLDQYADPDSSLSKISKGLGNLASVVAIGVATAGLGDVVAGIGAGGVVAPTAVTVAGGAVTGALMDAGREGETAMKAGATTKEALQSANIHAITGAVFGGITGKLTSLAKGAKNYGEVAKHTISTSLIAPGEPLINEIARTLTYKNDSNKTFLENFVSNAQSDGLLTQMGFASISKGAVTLLSGLSNVKAYNKSENKMEIPKSKIDSSKVTTVTLENDKKLLLNFNNLSDSEKIEIIKQANSEELNEILGMKSQLSPEMSEIIKNKILQNQDTYFTGKLFLNRNANIDDFILDSDSYKELSNDSLISLLNSKSNNKLLQEFMRRIDSGEFTLNRLPYVEYRNGKMHSDLIDSLVQLPEKYQNKILQQIKNSGQDLPDNIKRMSSQAGNISFQSYFIEAYKSGRIDAQGLQLLEKIYNENPSKLKYMDYGLLNSNYINDIGEDYLRIIINTPQVCGKIQYLHDNHKNLYDVFIKQLNNSKSDNSLYTMYQKTLSSIDFLHANSESLSKLDDSVLNSDSLMNYILYTARTKYSFDAIKVNSFGADYEKELIAECDKLFNTSASSQYVDLGEVKKAFFTKYFSMGPTDVKNLIKKYGMSLDTISLYDPESAQILKFIKQVNELEDPELLKQLYNESLEQIKFNPEEILHLDNSLRRAYALSYTDELKLTHEKVMNDIKNLTSNVSTINVNGKDINIVSVDDEFSFIVRSTDSGIMGATSEIDSSYISKYNTLNNPNSHILASSYINETNIGSCQVGENGVLYGFGNIDESKIAMISTTDMHSNINSLGYSALGDQVFVTPNEMSSYTTRVYNEIALERAGTTPDYVIIYSDMSEKLKNNAYNAASEWDIPVINIDKKALAESQSHKFNQFLSEFSTTNDSTKLESALDLFTSNTNGYRLNNAEETKVNSYFSSLFSKDKLETTIKKYIADLETRNDNVKEVDNLINIINKNKEKYISNNMMGNNAVYKTTSGIDYDQLIALAESIRKGY